MSTVQELRCPFGDFSGGYLGLHQHLNSEHPQCVAFVARGSRHYYEVHCPSCELVYSQAIKSGQVDDEFVEEFQAEIRLVGSDILVQHLIGEHPSEVLVGEEL